MAPTNDEMFKMLVDTFLCMNQSQRQLFFIEEKRVATLLKLHTSKVPCSSQEQAEWMIRIAMGVGIARLITAIEEKGTSHACPE